MRDEGHDLTEAILRETELDVEQVYTQAAQEVEKKLNKYLQRFEVKDQAKRQQLAAGKITEAEYNYWRTGQLAIGQRWQEMRDTLAEDLHNANGIARSIVQGHMPEVYALNHNYGTFQVEKTSGVDTSYTLYDRQTVERIIRDQPDLLPMPGQQIKQTFADFDAYKSGATVELTNQQKKAFDKLIASGKDIRWQKGQIQSVMTQAILQGESAPNIARRIAKTMGELNRKATIRYVRTAMTGAQNAGRVDSYKRAQDMGIELEQEWLAVMDNRTRHEHRQLDGQHVPVNQPFKVDGYEIKYPGDPAAPGHLIWNCRCTLIPRLKSLEKWNGTRNHAIDDTSYEQWKNEHIKKQVSVVDGHDISSTWTRRGNQYKFEIEDVIAAQGFDGLPRVVSPEEFNAAVKAANNGQGFIAQRTYSAPNQEILDAYREQLYRGKWYVDCGTGGANYGQGMYCAADYHGVLSSGIKDEMRHYMQLNGDRAGGELASVATKREITQDIIRGAGLTGDRAKAADIYIRVQTKTGTATSEEIKFVNQVLGREGMRSLDTAVSIVNNSFENCRTYIETMTLDPSAKIITHAKLVNMKNDAGNVFLSKAIESELEGASEPVKAFYRINQGKTQEGDWSIVQEWAAKDPAGLAAAEKRWAELKTQAQDVLTRFMSMDDGAYAAMLGFDAIDAEGHGQSGSYTVILNRTKVIILGGD